MQLTTWNLNHRVGSIRYRPEAPEAAIALNADVLTFTEFYPQQHEEEFRRKLCEAGWRHQLISEETGEVANRVFMASRVPVSRYPLDPPTFDAQFPANVLPALIDSLGIVIVALRVPAYKEGGLLSAAWQWLEQAAGILRNERAVLLGDFNVAVGTSSASGKVLQSMLDEGWQRATCTGPTYYGPAGRTGDIDHILATSHRLLSDAQCVRSKDGFEFCGSPAAISDHAALMCRVEVAQ